MSFGRYGKPGAPKRIGRANFSQRHYEQLAEMFRGLFKTYPEGTPGHIRACSAMAETIKMLREDNPKFQEFLFIQWVNTP
jgi:phosphatidylglycerophosphatase A